MKWLTYSCLLLCSLKLWAGSTYLLYPKGKFRYEGSLGDLYLTGKNFHEFTIYEKKDPANIKYGTVEKLNKWTRAYRLRMSGETFCTVHSSFFSWGSFFDSLKQFEIYDEQENSIGTIEGKYDTEGAAEFLFYNNQRDVFAVAIIDKWPYSKMTIKDSNDEILFLCSKTFEKGHIGFFEKKPTKYFWTIEKISSAPFNPCFFWPFMAFICDVWWSVYIVRE